MNIQVKRVYDPVTTRDGFRVLVDRLWPRGLSKEAARVDHWAKTLAPSTELRRWFHGDDADWQEFRKRYREELSARIEAAKALRDLVGDKRAMFLYASKDEAHNHAQVLKAFLERL